MPREKRPGSGDIARRSQMASEYAALRPDDRPAVGPIRNHFPLLRFRPQGGQSRIVRRDEFEAPVTQMGSPDAGPSPSPNLQNVVSRRPNGPRPTNVPGCAGNVDGGQGDGRGPAQVISSMIRRRCS
jgi:hypothetical protein